MKTNKIEYYYTWKGMDSWNYREESKARKNAPKGAYPVGFEYEKEAEAFCKGGLDQYIRDNCRSFETAVDAVIYTDGSFDEKNRIASYGLIIFFRGEKEPHIESGTIENVDAVRYKIVIYDESGNEVEDGENIKEVVEGYKDFVSSQNVAGELFGAMRALEICCQKRKLKKVLMVYDCELIKTIYDDRKKPYGSNGKASSAAYRKLLQDLEDVDIQFIKVDSHSKKEKGQHQYQIETEEYPHAVYNDLVDILAKAEVGKMISPGENINAFRAISDEFKRFSDVGADKREEKREHTRKLVQEVLNKSDGIFRPVFK